MGIDESLFPVDETEEIKQFNNLHLVANGSDPQLKTYLSNYLNNIPENIIRNLADSNAEHYPELFDAKRNPLTGSETNGEIDEQKVDPGDRYYNDTLELGKGLYIVEESEVKIK